MPIAPPTETSENPPVEIPGSRFTAALYDPFVWFGERLGMAERRRDLLAGALERLTRHPEVTRAGADACLRWGAGATGSRLVTGSAVRSTVRSAIGCSGSTIWTGSPSSTPNVVLSASCRNAMAVRLRSNAAMSSGPLNRKAAGTLYAALSGSH